MDELQLKKIALMKAFFGFAVVATLLWAVGVLPLGSGGGLLGAELAPNVNSTTSQALINTTTTLSFPARSQATVRIFENFSTSGAVIYLSFATSTSLDRSERGLIIKASTTLIMTDENGLLHRGDVYTRSSQSSPTSTLRLTQYP